MAKLLRSKYKENFQESHLFQFRRQKHFLQDDFGSLVKMKCANLSKRSDLQNHLFRKIKQIHFLEYLLLLNSNRHSQKKQIDLRKNITHSAKYQPCEKLRPSILDVHKLQDDIVQKVQKFLHP